MWCLPPTPSPSLWFVSTRLFTEKLRKPWNFAFEMVADLEIPDVASIYDRDTVEKLDAVWRDKLRMFADLTPLRASLLRTMDFDFLSFAIDSLSRYPRVYNNDTCHLGFTFHIRVISSILIREWCIVHAWPINAGPRFVTGIRDKPTLRDHLGEICRKVCTERWDS